MPARIARSPRATLRAGTALAFALAAAAAARAAGSGMPWEEPLQKVLEQYLTAFAAFVEKQNR